MPQIDAAAYFPIIFWSTFLILLGYLLFYFYALLPLSGLMKLGDQWSWVHIPLHELHWNEEFTTDWAAWFTRVVIAWKFSDE